MQEKKKQTKNKKGIGFSIDPVILSILIFIFMTFGAIVYYYKVTAPKMQNENQKKQELQKEIKQLKEKISKLKKEKQPENNK